MKDRLTAWGHDVDAVDHAAAALERLDARKPSLAILDESVNDLTSEEWLAALQNRELDTFVLLITPKEDLNRAMNLVTRGAFACLTPETSPEQLRDLINRGLETQEAYHHVVRMAADLKEANQRLTREQGALKDKTEKLRFLNDLSVRLSATLDAVELARTIDEGLERWIPGGRTVFLAHVPGEPDLRLYGAPFLSENSVRRMAEALAPGIGVESIDRIRFMGAGQRSENDFPGRETLSFPLTAAGRRFGLMVLWSETAAAPDPDLTMLLESTALLAAQALFNAHQHEQALRLASRDSLTGLFNRRAFMELLGREFGRHLRHGTDLSVILIDLDHFKSVNDRFGHDAGDRVLVQTARLIEETVRNVDVAARLGGEEFVVLAPDTREEDVMILARRIEAALDQAPILLGDVHWTQTVSQGVADARHIMVKSPQDLLRWADRAMYQAKADGRRTIRRASNLPKEKPRKEPLYAW
jgi:diguanylate cyclase (GGDEF)-like protein